MAKTNPETIFLKGEPNRKQRDAGGVITPGEFLDLNSSDAVLRHAAAGVVMAAWIAVENDIGGDEIGDDYASGEVVQFNACRKGDEVYGFIDVLENIVIGDLMESAGNGRLRVLASGVAVAMALEAKDLSVTGTAAARIKMEIL